MYPAVATSAGALEFNGNISSIRVCTGSSNPKDCRP
jgi:hypothetical protein